ncbi:MAG: type II secretion system F family protein [Candidatus Eremiobacteraeota bacterium]|nr:type II secretion system F family protein [Candidatus Eremiobacteraeota bacterium]
MEEGVETVHNESVVGLDTVPIKLTSRSESELYVEVLELCKEALIRADRVLILLQENNSLAVKASYGSKAAFMIMREEVSSAIIRRVRRKNRAVYINDALADEDLGPRQSIRRIGQRSVLVSPINSRGKNIGILYADSISLIGAFTDEDLRWSIRLATALGKKITSVEKSEAAPVIATERPISNSLLPWHQLRKVDALSEPEDTLLMAPLPKGAEKVVFLRSLACMVSSGFPIHGALDLLADSPGRMAPYATRIAEDVAKGMPMSRAFGKHPRIFGKDFINLIYVGENSGTLDNVMTTLADAEEANMLMKTQVMSALTYPIIVFLFTAIGCMLAPPLFLNDFFASLQAANVQLPLLTRMVMHAAAAMWNPYFWVVVLSTIVGLKTFVAGSRRKEEIYQYIERALLRTAVFGEIYKDLSILRFARALGMQLDAGMYLDKSIKLAGEASGSPLLNLESKQVVDRVAIGESFSFALESSQFFPKLLIEFIRIGEETATMPQMCQFVVSLLAMKTQNSIEMLQSLIEPLAMALVGILVGAVAIACLLPLVQMVMAFI